MAEIFSRLTILTPNNFRLGHSLSIFLSGAEPTDRRHGIMIGLRSLKPAIAPWSEASLLKGTGIGWASQSTMACWTRRDRRCFATLAAKFAMDELAHP